MAKPSDFSIRRSHEDDGYSYVIRYDYVISGVPLAARILKHEGLTLDHQSSLGGTDGAEDRLLLRSDPDLCGGAVALYLCGLCGGYDGNPVGAQVRREGDLVVWENLGFYSDIEESSSLFSKVRSFTFDWKQYEEVLLAPR